MDLTGSSTILYLAT